MMTQSASWEGVLLNTDSLQCSYRNTTKVSQFANASPEVVARGKVCTWSCLAVRFSRFKVEQSWPVLCDNDDNVV